MRAKDFIKLYESPGFNAPGPSGLNFPRGYNLSHMTGGMYPTSARFGADKTIDFNKEPLTATSKKIHVDRIEQRINGGMSEEEAISSYANQTSINVKELTVLYNRYKSRPSIT